MGATPRFGTDGVRGAAHSELTESFVLDLGRAAARVLRVPRVILGGDTRASTPTFLDALSRGFALEGVDVTMVDVAPTPAVAWLAALDGAAAAVVTASHNPYTDNGVKVFAAGGRKLTDDIEAAIEAEVHSLPDAGRVIGAIEHDATGVQRYLDHFVDRFAGQPLTGLKIVLDCANGAMSVVAPEALRALGAELTVINASPDGENINRDCGATHPAALVDAVRSSQADAGLAFDGDGDRVIAVDGAGGLIDGDRLMAIVAPAMKAEGLLTMDTVVVTVMSNLGFRHAMEAAGVTVAETAVGDRYVLEVLERDGLSLGGEQSGHVIFRDLATTGDGLLAGLMLLDTARRSGRSLAELAKAAMVSYPQVLVNVRLPRPMEDIVSLVAAEIEAAEAELGGDGRVLVRRSGTEPLARVMVEAPTAERAREVADHLAAAIARRLPESTAR